jgi:hypothetical protein
MKHIVFSRHCLYQLGLALVALCLLPVKAMAWYDGTYPPPPYTAPYGPPPYAGPNYGYSGWPGYPGYNGYPPYGYDEPRFYFRGRMNSYGDYEFRIRVENMNMNDLYNAWLWFQNSQY